MTDSKIFYPEVIDSYNIPDTEEPGSKTSYGGTKNVFVQEGIVQTNFQLPITAREVLSRTLDTQRKKILGEYTFGSSGAMKIGNYESGVSGDINISPSGITGRNSSNVTTFAIDGTTGDATFGGTLTAGVIVAVGALVVGTNVGIGTAQDSAGVTTIIGNTVTTGFINALSITAGSVSADNITAGILTGSTVRTKASGVRVQLNANEANIYIYDADNDQAFLIDDNGTSIGMVSGDNRNIIVGADKDLTLVGDVDVLLEATAGILYLEAGDKIVGLTTLNMNSNDILAIGRLQFNQKTKSYTTTEGSLYLYPDGPNVYWGSYQDGWHGKFSQVAQ